MRTYLFLFALTVCPALVLRADWASENAKLTTAYKLALASLPPTNTESLRRAERAWITFSNKNEDFVKMFAAERRLPDEFVWSYEHAEITAQVEWLNLYAQGFRGDLPRAEALGRLDTADQNMTTAYQEVIEELSPALERALREAQRAWITFRDECARSNNRSDAKIDALNSSFDLTSARAAELHVFLHVGGSEDQKSLTDGQVGGPGVGSDASPPPPTAGQKAQAAEIIANADALLKRGLGEPSLAAPATDFSTVTPFSDSMRDALDSANLNFEHLAAGSASVAASPSYDRAGRILRGLAAWNNAAIAIHASSDARSSSDVLHSQLQGNKKPPDGAETLWARLEALLSLCDKRFAEAQEHLRKSAEFSSLGKESDAIHETELAYKLCPDPITLTRLKTLRESSLGL